MVKDTVCVVNPRSGGGRTAGRWPELARALASAGIDADVRFTEGPGGGTTAAREALAAGARTIIAVGGDGTVHEVVNGFFDGDRPLNPAARLGVLPAGSGSDLVKSLGLPGDERGAIRTLQAGPERLIDLGRVTYIGHDGGEESRYYINTASAGLSGAAMSKMKTLPPWTSGPLGYVLASVLAVVDFKPFQYTLRADDGEATTGKAIIIVTGNGRYFGAGMKVLPDAELDDGLLDMLIFKERPVPELLAALPLLYTGSHLQHPAVETARAKRIQVSGDRPMLLEVDGEQPGVTPATFEIVPRALTVIA